MIVAEILPAMEFVGSAENETSVRRMSLNSETGSH